MTTTKKARILNIAGNPTKAEVDRLKKLHPAEVTIIHSPHHRVVQHDDDKDASTS